jgi:hypothetical protein
MSKYAMHTLLKYYNPYLKTNNNLFYVGKERYFDDKHVRLHNGCHFNG